MAFSRAAALRAGVFSLRRGVSLSTPVPTSSLLLEYAERRCLIHKGHQSTRPMSSFARRPNPNLRTHAVSIIDGNYNDYNSGNDGPEQAFPTDGEDNDWELSPSDAIEEYDEGGIADLFSGGDSELDRKVSALALEQHRAHEANKKKWLENSKPKVRVRQIDEKGRSNARGSRKTANAGVFIFPGEGFVTVNNKDIVDYFDRESDREHLLSPFVATRTCGKFDVRCHVTGGGKTGQAGAIRLGIARALEKYNPDYRASMKRLGYLTRDPRMVERKKIGLKKARKAPQWVRR
uniref:30S ribosomal protein S9, chloroplastic n=1 Tax=Odontella aurita TaxID=265563 RepID=A0A7S4IP46_9STRA|mmetsp:Transcript_2803/g.7352  ORF Transcript_2803/g.7352 Transcript_2803/m.7352 type:complete len:291 (+) Transcript_2803:165-1037(+)